jgi:hypothetical protein
VLATSPFSAEPPKPSPQSVLEFKEFRKFTRFPPKKDPNPIQDKENQERWKKQVQELQGRKVKGEAVVYKMMEDKGKWLVIVVPPLEKSVIMTFSRGKHEKQTVYQPNIDLQMVTIPADQSDPVLKKLIPAGTHIPSSPGWKKASRVLIEGTFNTKNGQVLDNCQYTILQKK